jgi:WD40 repeat protein
VTASYDKTLKLWYAAAPFSCTATLEGHTHRVTSCAWCPDGLTIASSSNDQTVRLWDAAMGNCFATLECGSGAWTCRWSSDGNTLAVGCGDSSLVLYDVQRA